ncbi:MAG: glycosyltransferase [Candidatus Nanopelagicales bacterium]
MPPDSELGTVDASRQTLLDCIGTAPELTFVRGPGNRGDELIWAGTRRLLHRHHYREIGVDELPRARGHTALLAGGGAWSQHYHEYMPTALAVAEARFDRVIVLPSSFDTRVDEVWEALAATRATVFARETESLRRIQGLCDARLAHDCAFFYDYEPHRRIGSGTLHAFRTDAESARLAPIPADNDDISATAASLDEWLDTIARHERVETDRAHVMIAAALLGKDVGFLPGGYFKVAALAATLPPEARVQELPPRPTSIDDRPPPAPVRHELQAAAAAHPAPSVAPVPLDAAPRVCAVIVSHNRPDHVAWAARSVQRSGPGVRTLILDNNSDDVTRRTLAELARSDPGISVRYSDRNLGCAGGRHLAVTDIKEEFVLYLDDDAELMPGALEHLVADLDQHPAAQAVTAHVVGPDGTTFHSGGSYVVSADTARFTLIGSQRRFDDPGIPPSGPCDWAPGTASLVRRSALDQCPVDPAMAAYYEDNEWALRMADIFDSPFRRSRAALAIHHFGPRPTLENRFAQARHQAQMLRTHAHFLAVHGVLLDSGGDELMAPFHGIRGLEGRPEPVRALLRAATDPERLAVDLLAGDLGASLGYLRGESDDASNPVAERDEAEARLAAAEDRIARLSARSVELDRIVNTRWWRWRRRVGAARSAVREFGRGRP